MSRKITQIALFLFITAAGLGTAAAQSTGINRVEFFGGYSNNQVDTRIDSDDFDDEFGSRLSAHGVNLSVTGNFSKWVGAKFDYAYHRQDESFDFEGFDVRQDYNSNTIMGGIQIKNNSKDGPRVKPFFHALAGISRQKITADDSGNDYDFELSQNNFTFALGGGVDIRATKNIDIRVFQVDYNPTYFKDQDFGDFSINGKLQNNVRFGFGIVIH